MHSEYLTFNQPIKFYYAINYKAIFFQIKTTTHKRRSHSQDDDRAIVVLFYFIFFFV